MQFTVPWNPHFSGTICRIGHLLMNKKTIIITVVAIALALAGVFGALRIGQNNAGETETGSTSRNKVEEATFAPQSTTAKETETAAEEVEVEPESEEDIDEDDLFAATGSDAGDIAPEFKEFWDEYEKFMKKYVSVMNDPENKDYEKLTEQYSKYSEKAAEYENSEALTDNEIRYMTDAQAKITAMYADALLS